MERDFGKVFTTSQHGENHQNSVPYKNWYTSSRSLQTSLCGR